MPYDDMARSDTWPGPWKSWIGYMGLIAVVTGLGAAKAENCITPDWRTRHPEWIWCDGFEDDAPLTEKYFEYGDDDGDFVPMDGVGVNGSRGMRVRFQAGEVSAGGLKKSFGRTPSTYIGRHAEQPNRDFDEIYWQLSVRRQLGWQGGGGAKLTRATVMASEQWAQGMIAHLWSGGPGDAYLVMDPASGVNPDGQLVSTKYNDFEILRWLGFKRGQLPLFDTDREDEWFCIEAHVKLNTPGASDGVFEFWINDELQAGAYDLNWHGTWNSDPARLKINAVFFENYWNAGSPITQERYFDNIIISTQRIGCSCAGPDEDQDGIPDEVEEESEAFKVGVDDRLVDTDQDGQTNSDEYFAGTDPLDPASRLEIRRIERGADELAVYFDGVLGKEYVVEQAAVPVSHSWTEAPVAAVQGSGGEARVALALLAGQNRFYRLRLR